VGGSFCWEHGRSSRDPKAMKRSRYLKGESTRQRQQYDKDHQLFSEINRTSQIESDWEALLLGKYRWLLKS